MLDPRWRKVLRDLWGTKGRTILVVLAIAVGVFAFGGVFTTQDVLLTDMRNGYLSISPASATLAMTPFDDHVVEAVRGMREVADAEGRTVFSVKLQVGPNRWVNIDLIAVADYNNVHINRMTPETGVWPPGRREILLERTSVPLAGFPQIGDMLIIELPSGQQRQIRFAGTVHDFNAIPANLFPQGTGYISLETLEWLGQPRLYSQLNLVVADPTPTQQEVELTVAEIRDRLEQRGYSVFFANIPEPGKHWGSDATQAFTAVLAGIGIFALILSGFMVVNTISSILAQQRRQIGMMKAVGAAGGQVVSIYLVTVTIFGLLALLIAVPIGIVLAWFNTQAVANFLNIDILNFRLPLWVFGLQVLTALIVPLGAALVPVLNGTRITVREAVSDYGIGQSSRQIGWFDRLLSRIRGLPRPTMLSLRNTFRRKGRLTLTLTTLTIAGAIFIAVLNVRSSLILELDKILRLFQYDLQISLDGLYGVRQVEREALRLDGITEVEGWAFAQVQRIRPDGTEGSTFTLFGPPADTDFISPIVLEGRWLTPSDQNAIVVSVDILREEPDIQVGDEIRLLMGDEKRDWRVVGIIDRVGQMFAYVNFSYLSRVQGYPGSSAVAMVGTAQHDGAFQREIGRTLEERLKRAGIGVSSTITLDEIYGANVAQFDFIIAFMMVMAVMLAIVGGLGLTGTMSLNVLERTREIGVIRAIGASNGAVRNIVLVEGVLIGLISWFLGTFLSIPLSWGLSAAVGLAFFERPMSLTFSPVGVLAWFGIAIVLAMLASILPARNASRISVREALAYE